MKLTKRQVQLLELFNEGLTVQQIANRMCVETSTVKAHSGRLYKQLNVSSRHQALAWYRGVQTSKGIAAINVELDRALLAAQEAITAAREALAKLPTI